MITAVLQARMSSKRLPGKVAKPILGKPMLALQMERIKRSKRIDKLVVATSIEREDDLVAEIAGMEQVDLFRGSLSDVLDRFYMAVREDRPEYVVRLTGDCPLVEPELIDSIISRCIEEKLDYCTNALQPTFPDGLDVEVFRFECLSEAWKEARLPSEREHVTLFIHSRTERFRIGHFKQHADLSGYRWTVDEPEDFELVEKIYQGLYPENPRFGLKDVLGFLDEHPELKTLNTRFERNEGMKKSIEADKKGGSTRYKKSEELLGRAQKVIPLGSQTFSKSLTQFPFGVSPYFITRGKGSRVWDVDGNEYIDFMNSLAAITLGYCDPDVDAAVKSQLENGTIFSLPHTLEMEVAEKLREIHEKIAEGLTAETPEDVVACARKLGYPVILRAAFALGGLGSGFASNDEECLALATQALSGSPQVLV
jgi:spore coat polysaccharide biosynthesis protein SpsF (cytidylyltransferase family)